MTTTALTGQPTRRGRIGRFTLHFFEMCAPMCVGFAIGDLIYFWAAGRFGYSHPFKDLPELSVVVITFTMTAPMVAWMVYRGMQQRAVAEMAAVMPVLAAALLRIRVGVGAADGRSCPLGTRADDAGDARSDAPSTRPLHQQTEPSPRRTARGLTGGEECAFQLSRRLPSI